MKWEAITTTMCEKEMRLVDDDGRIVGEVHGENYLGAIREFTAVVFPVGQPSLSRGIFISQSTAKKAVESYWSGKEEK
jgi:hypothetical protein